VKLNLGCGTDVKQGYVNVDFRDLPGVMKVDLSKFPWPFDDESADEVMMLDFLEHFPYRDTEKIIFEAYRILKKDGKIILQVPDLDHCSRAASFIPPFLCNNCGWEFPVNDDRAKFYLKANFVCNKCGRSWRLIAGSAVARLYGGQDYHGNWHFTAFSKLILEDMLSMSGFGCIEEIQKNENGETFYANWNLKLVARKLNIIWEE